MFCSHCGEGIEEDSRFCRYCGHAQPIAELVPPVSGNSAPVTGPTAEKKRFDAWVMIAVITGVILVILMFASLGGKSGPGADVHAENADAVADNLEMAADNVAVPAANDEGPWTYTSDEDKVRGGTSYFASTTSTNSIRQETPYDSVTTMRLTVRKAPGYGTDVIFTISSGQLMCPSYEGCSGTVRFDDGPARRISFNGPADNSSDTIFVEGVGSFIANMKKAKRVIIEKTVYEAGNPQFEFDIHGLKWSH